MRPPLSCVDVFFEDDSSVAAGCLLDDDADADADDMFKFMEKPDLEASPADNCDPPPTPVAVLVLTAVGIDKLVAAGGSCTGCSCG